MPNSLILAVYGKKGHERQALAIARRLGGGIRVQLLEGRAGSIAVPEGTDVVIAAGRQAIAPARRIALRPAPRPLVAVLQPVAWRASRFDLVWAPLHDRNAVPFARGRRLETLTAPSAVTLEERREGAAAVAAAAPELGGTRVGVLVGGPSRSHRFGPAEAEEFAARLVALGEAHDASLLVTTSPRTGLAVTEILRERLSGTPHLFVDAAVGGPVTPSLAYAGILERADALVVTTDSFAMLSDAAATGKPIHGWRLPGGRAKFETLYAGLVAHGAMRWFDGTLEPWSYPPLDAAGVVAEAILSRLPAGLPGGAEGRI